MTLGYPSHISPTLSCVSVPPHEANGRLKSIEDGGCDAKFVVLQCAALNAAPYFPRLTFGISKSSCRSGRKQRWAETVMP